MSQSIETTYREEPVRGVYGKTTHERSVVEELY
jgi:hypothetical protein